MSICRCKIHERRWDSDTEEACPECAPVVGALRDKAYEIESFLNQMTNLSDDGFTMTKTMFPLVFEILSDNLKNLNKKINKMNQTMFG